MYFLTFGVKLVSGAESMMLFREPGLIKYTNSYELCWVPLGRLKETQPVRQVIIVHCTKALVSVWRFGYQVT